MASQGRKTEHSENKAQTHPSAKPVRPGPVVAELEADQLQALQRAVHDPRQARPADIMTLQRTVGNRAVSRLVQAKLIVGAVGDRYEQEADRVAEQVLTMPAPVSDRRSAPGHHPALQRAEEEEEVQTKPLVSSISALVQRAEEEEEEVQAKSLVQRAEEEEEEVQAKSLIQRAEEEEEEVQAKPLIQRAEEEEEEVQAKPLIQRAEEEEEEVQAKPLAQRRGDGSFEVGSALEGRLASRRGSGSPLSAEIRAFMEPRFGADFSGVRVHTGAEAAQMNRELNAQAFTHGQDVYFRSGTYNPGSEGGKRLLAHELTHVVQQSGRNDRIARWGSRNKGTKHDVVTNAGFADLDPNIRKWYSPAAREYLAHHSDDMDMRAGFIIPVGWRIFKQTVTKWRGKGMYAGDMSVEKAWKIAEKNAKKNKQGGPSRVDMLKVYRAEQRKRAEAYDAMEGYGRDPGEARNHAEAGMYKGLNVEANIQRYTQYINNAIEAWKANNPTQALHVLSLALHTAQDRGAHGDGVPGLGHDPRRLTPPPAEAKMGWIFYRSNPNWKPGDKPTWGGFDTDKQETNPNGFKMAVKETQKVLTAFALGIGLKPGTEVDEEAMDAGRGLTGWKKPSWWRRFGRKGAHIFGGPNVITTS